MIHYSNPKCDVCGERHSDGHTEECRDALVGQLAAMAAERDRLTFLVEAAFREGCGTGRRDWSPDLRMASTDYDWMMSAARGQLAEIAKAAKEPA